jgi:hypothetical protein
MKTKLVEIHAKKTTFNKKEGIYNNGDFNEYPQKIDRLINNSVTAKMASNLMIQYLLGKGFGETDNFIVNKTEGLKLIRFADDLANAKVKQRGLAVHVNINANYRIRDMKAIPFPQVRLGKKDDSNYNGKVLICKDWTDKKATDKAIAYDVFNLNKSVIDSQVEKAGGWDNYKGQVLFINDDNEYVYPLSRFDAVQTDLDNEYQCGVYKNQILRKGFFGKTMMIRRKSSNNDIPETIVDADGLLVRNPDFARLESEQEENDKVIKNFLGADNVDGVLLVTTDFAGEKLEDAVKFQNIESNIQPDLFEKIEVSLRKNILVACNNLPLGLVMNSDSLFGQGASAILEMKKSFWENTEKERDELITILNDLLRNFEGYNGGELIVKKLFKDDTINQPS